MIVFIDNLSTPLGMMEIEATDHMVKSIHFVEELREVNQNALTTKTKHQLHGYFTGQRQRFDLPLAASGTDFQQQVWRALAGVEYGQTCSYGAIAKKIKNPKAVRAVGAANGKNPLSIVVPCHRVIGANGSLVGYASGNQRKAWLLNHEAKSLSLL